jgi:hypothetical protein
VWSENYRLQDIQLSKNASCQRSNLAAFSRQPSALVLKVEAETFKSCSLADS